MVMNTEKELDKAYRDYSEGFFGVPWDHRLNDDEWREVRPGEPAARRGAGGRAPREREKERCRGAVFLVLPVRDDVIVGTWEVAPL